ncbi:MAG: aminotransferase class I/II-fold pyridoxal phosphate-dependent enzyme [Acidimicrobiales bacterium]
MPETPVIPIAGRHGGDGPAIAAALGCSPADVLDLSQTLNPFAPDVAAIAASKLGALSHYPDPRRATEQLAEAIGIESERLLLTNGGAEAISLVARVVGGRVRSEPEFALHPRSATGPLWRSDPHSPSGSLAAPDEAADVWDEAFFAMATGRWTGTRPGTVVGSLTKLFACPGLRLGYVIDDDVNRFAAVQPHWSVSSIALAVLPHLLAQAKLDDWAGAIATARAALADLFTERGFGVAVADAPWVLVEAPGLRERLVPERIVVRDCTNFGLPGIVRVAVTDDAGRRRLADALDRMLGQ